eukprot:scaffold376000_cov46-Prasinocladus_malaysianus.AAC.1
MHEVPTLSFIAYSLSSHDLNFFSKNPKNPAEPFVVAARNEDAAGRNCAAVPKTAGSSGPTIMTHTMTPHLCTISSQHVSPSMWLEQNTIARQLAIKIRVVWTHAAEFLHAFRFKADAS